jgi:ABC-type Fe3+-hydroxamate transport system substrate-binding protein
MFYQSSGRSSAARRSAAIAVVLGLSSWLSICAAADSTASEPAAASTAAVSSQSDKTVDHANGTVSFIDKKNSIIVVTLKSGRELSLNAKDHSDVLDRVSVGNKVAIAYLEPYVTALTPMKGAKLTRLTHSVKVTQSAADSGQDGFRAVRTYDGVVEVTAINSKLNLLTIADRTGTAQSVKVSQPDLVTVMNSLARHEHVQLTYESAFKVSITH